MTKLTKSYNFTAIIQPTVLSKVFVSRLAWIATAMVSIGATALPAYADTIYKVVDEKTGQITFTDRPQSYQNQDDTQVSPVSLSTPTYSGSYNTPYAQPAQPPIQPPMQSIVQPSSSNNHILDEATTDEQPQEQSTTPTSPNYQIRLTEPSSERAYRRPVQSIDVQAQVSPKLQSSDKVVVYLDGKEVAQGLSGSIPTVDILPGEHQLSVFVEGAKGNKITEANQTVYVIQNTQALQNKKRLEEQLQAYQQLPWYKKLYIRMRQDTNPPAPAK